MSHSFLYGVHLCASKGSCDLNINTSVPANTKKSDMFVRLQSKEKFKQRFCKVLDV